MQKKQDVLIIGGGLIGLSLAWQLSRRGVSVAVLERNEPGQEASHAGGGMIADLDPVLPSELLELGHRSAVLYPEFIRELAEASGEAIDLRANGVIAFEQHPIPEADGIRAISQEQARALEPKLARQADPAYTMRERSTDPRDLVRALLAALAKSGVAIHTNESAQKIFVEQGRAAGVVTASGTYAAEKIVNCAGSWATQIGGPSLPTMPVKGHMVALAFPGELKMPPAEREPQRVLRHVLRSRWCYIIPRSNGRYVVGSTVEPGGYDKSLNAYRVKRLQEAAARLIPEFAEAKIVEAWTGLRPGTPDNLPLLGETALPGYYAACGHYRDGILLTPVTAEILCGIMLNGKSPVNIERFAPTRFA
ncbi:MAG: glycine oxidase ThiO [Acidobacteriota bacterium]|nr:glycine oxidase ThiO [Acidobacteriota bacterium]